MNPSTTNSKRHQPRRARALLGAPARNLLTLAICAAVWMPPGHAAAASPITLPWRGDALDPGVYFRSAGHTNQGYGNGAGNSGWGIDFHAAKWESPEWETSPGGGQNTDEYIFGVPVYSPVDGEIVACWRTAPDKPAPNVHYDFDGDGIDGEAKNCVNSDTLCKDDSECPVNDSCGRGHDASPVGSGNHVQIRTADGDDIILLAHLQWNSIPANLCPLPAARDDADTTSSPGSTIPGVSDGWPDNDTDDCNTPGLEGWQRDTILSTPVAIKQGDRIGNVGHSGQSTRPHLHMQVTPLSMDGDDFCVGTTQEMEFYESWSQECASGEAPSGGWSALDGDNPLEPYDIIETSCTEDSDCDTMAGETCSNEECVIATPAYCFLPDAIGLQEDLNDLIVQATNLHFTTHPDGDVLVYQSSGDLRLRSYDVSAGGDIVFQDTQNEGAVLDVAVASPDSSNRHVVVSIRGSNDNLKHIPYSVSNVNGAITRMVGNELTESDVLQVESTPSPAHDGYVVAIEDDNGNLKVIDYHVNAFLDITRDLSGTGTGGAIDDIAITTMTNFDGVVTAEITAAGYLVVRSFEVPAGGGVTAVDDQLSIVSGSSVTVDRVPTSVYLGEGFVVTSVIQDDETLRLDSWAVDTDGFISWVDYATTGVVSEHDGTAGSTIVGDFVTGLRDSDDEFRMIGWDVDWLGQIRRNSTREQGPVTDLGLVASSTAGGDYLVVARTDAGGGLFLVTYAENYSGWF